MVSSIRRLSPRRLLPAPFGNLQATTSTIPGPTRPGIPAAVLALSVTLAGCAGTGVETADVARPAAVGTHGASAAPGTTQAVPGRTSADSEASAASVPEQLPGLGPRTLADVPANARQVVLVTGRGKNSSESEVVLYRRTSAGWEPGATWPAHNALKGWTDDHRLNDLRSPIGVFTLTDAGGLLPDPGTELPYDQSQSFTIGGTGFEGEPLAGSFDYVVAINYNRKPGTSPLDWTRPLGADKGGGIWLHVDHGGPTHGCVSLAQQHMKELLRTLDPDRHPVIVMGDAASLKR
ncbi:L,D-transpeptidase family protein [Streptomyces sp. HC307]|uniref:L,D-transpeptidase family protein n=1 Tax=Streptomyces flavusporus TaxID=3385496 RepID=UPI003916FD88